MRAQRLRVQADYAARFVREMGCTVDELRAWLPGASRGAAIEWLGTHAAYVDLRAFAPSSPSSPTSASPLQLHLVWTPLTPRRIALITLPRLQVSFDFGSADEATRHRYMRHFDLYTQRGGG
ncbi:MAG: hypothetical protein ACOVOZ_00755 [Burkholderiaceae bacterium]